MTNVPMTSRNEHHFVTGSYSYTHRFARYVIGLLKAMILKNASCLLDVSCDTIKDIHLRYLERHYSPPSVDGVDCIGIDEFAVKKGHIYKTIVVDLRTGRILYVTEKAPVLWIYNGNKSERKVLKSNISPQTCLLLSSHPYLKIVLTRYMCLIIFM